jgi:hypothetical protein
MREHSAHPRPRRWNVMAWPTNAIIAEIRSFGQGSFLDYGEKGHGPRNALASVDALSTISSALAQRDHSGLDVRRVVVNTPVLVVPGAGATRPSSRPRRWRTL